MMSAVTQLRPNNAGSPDLAVRLAAVQALPESLAIVESGLILYANPACARMFECDPSQLQGRAVEDFIPWPGMGTDVRALGNGAGLRIEVSSAEFRMKGREFQVINPRDVGPRRQAEKRSRESHRMEAVGRLVSGVAHDFNNLLTGIMLYCDLLITELEKGSRSRRHALEMRTAGEHGARLVQQLLAVARPPAEESRVFGLNDVITGIEDLLTRLVGENIVLHTALAADLGTVRMNPAQVQQILLNLVINARDAMPDGGRIVLSTRNCSEPFPDGQEAEPLKPCVELTVSDTGCGMDAETLNRAFEPFFTTKQSGRGSGLGLATARRLASQEGGTIAAESQPGRGTTVSLRLPRVNQDAPANSKAKEVIS